MDLSRPFAAIAPTVDSEVLVALLRDTRSRSGRQLARELAPRSQAAVNEALSRLTRQGMVSRQEAPPAFVYELNREHVGIAAVEALSSMRSEFFSRLKAELEEHLNMVHHASVFGSMARADGDVNSDIDLLLVWREGETGEPVSEFDRVELARRLERKVLGWTGNHLSIVEVEIPWIPRAARGDGSAVWREILQDGIDIVGPPFRQLVADANGE